MQKITLIGNLTKDPERYDKDGKTSVNFTLASDRRFKDKSGNTITDFWSVWVRGGIADCCAKYLKKGSKVAVIGEPQPRQYEKRDGGTGFSLNVAADEVEFLTPKKEQKNEDFSDINVPDLPWEV